LQWRFTLWTGCSSDQEAHRFIGLITPAFGGRPINRTRFGIAHINGPSLHEIIAFEQSSYRRCRPSVDGL